MPSSRNTRGVAICETWKGLTTCSRAWQTPEELLETTVEEMSKDASGGAIDLQKILELKGLKKAEMDRIVDAIKDASFMSASAGAAARARKMLGNLGS